MNPPHFRGSQPPTSHIVPGAPGMIAHPPYPMEPPLIPAFFLAETIAAIRRESAGQARIINDQYSSVVRGYAEMNSRFEVHTRQTDRILAEQYERFEQVLNSIRRDTRHIYDHQMAAITDLGARLSALEDASEASKDALASRITTVAETIGHGFDYLAAMMRKGEYGESFRLPIRTLPKLFVRQGLKTRSLSKSRCPQMDRRLKVGLSLSTVPLMTRSNNPYSFLGPLESQRWSTCKGHRMRIPVQPHG